MKKVVPTAEQFATGPDKGAGAGVRADLFGADIAGYRRSGLVTASGAGREPRAKAFDPSTGDLLGELLVFDQAFLGGFFVAAG